MRKSDTPPVPATLNAAAPEFTPSFQSFGVFTPSTGTDSDYGCGASSGYCDYDWTPATVGTVGTVGTWEMPKAALPEVVPGTREGEYLGLQCILKEHMYRSCTYYIYIYTYDITHIHRPIYNMCVYIISLLDQLLAEKQSVAISRVTRPPEASQRWVSGWFFVSEKTTPSPSFGTCTARRNPGMPQRFFKNLVLQRYCRCLV